MEQLKSRFAEQDKIDEQLSEDIAALKREHATPKDEMLCDVSDGERDAQMTTRGSTKHPQKSIQQESSQQAPMAKGLTALHMEILKCLMVLQVESGRRNINMRELAAELYPHKTYSIIKATLSEYIKKLHQYGFVEKLHKGRLYLSYTEKALQFADDRRLNMMRELISKPGVR